MTQQPLPAQFAINISPEAEEGHYADFAHVWHNQETFILDFAAMAHPPQPDGEPPTSVQITCRVVTRVRIPASQCFELMKALEQQLTAWELETGRRRPEGPGSEEPGV